MMVRTHRSVKETRPAIRCVAQVPDTDGADESPPLTPTYVSVMRRAGALKPLWRTIRY
jgi:hypothetical protein